MNLRLLFIAGLLAVPARGASPAAVPAAAAGTPALDPAKVEFFEKRIRPLLADRCEKCHSAASGKSKGDLTLDTRAGWEKGGQNGPAIVPGQPDQSLLLKAIAYADPDLRMPPRKEGGPLPEADVAAVRRWIAEGAMDPRSGPSGHRTGLSPEARAHWAFQPVRKPSLPEVRDTAWGHNEVDRFILARLEAAGLQPNPPASRETLLRRVTYDLTGLPPTLDEVNDFVADLSPGAFERVVDRLLASPRYGERWGRHWLDTARYSDTTGLSRDGGGRRYEDYRYEYAWTYRDYVIQSLNADKPWNDFLTEQLAADQLPGVASDDPRLAALGFLTVGRRFENGDDIVDERIDATGKAMLGLTVSCARCHDHKFDPIPTADYYSWHGIFSSVTEPYDLPELSGTSDPGERETFQRRLATLEAKNRTLFQGFFQRKIPEFQRHAEGYLMVAAQKPRSPERQELAKRYQVFPGDPEILRAIRMTPDHPVLGPFARLAKLDTNEFAAQAPDVLLKALASRKAPVNRLVAEALLGLKPNRLEDVAQVYGRLFSQVGTNTTLLLQRRGRPDGPQDLDDPAMTELAQMPYRVPTYSEIATSEAQEAYLADRSGRRAAMGPPPFEPKTLNAFQFAAINQLRLTHPGAPGRAMVVADKPKPADSYIRIRGDRAKRGPVVPRRFLEILSGPDRMPFTQGSGRLELARAIVDPANPLTARVIVNRVWMHHFGRGLVPTPDDLGTMSEPPSHPELLDFLASGFMEQGWSLKRLHKLILMSAAYQQGGETRPDFQARDPENRLVWRANLRRLEFEAIRDSLVALTGKMDTTLGGKPVNLTDEPYSYRRSVYGYVDRLRLSDLLSQFDFSDPEMVNTRRISTIVPQQALFFLNSPMTVDVARHLMNRPEVDSASDDPARVAAIYRILFQRPPEPREVQWALDFIDRTHELLYGSQRAQGPRTSRSVYKSTKLTRDKYAPVQNAGVTVQRGALNPWESYVQALLCSNEFVYVN